MANIEYIFDNVNGPKLSLINSDGVTTSSLYIDGAGRLAVSGSGGNLVASASYAQSGGSITSSAQLSNGGGFAFGSGNNVTFNQITASNASFTNLFVQTITSSVDYASGSNVFGTNMTDTHRFTGSVSITGSLTATTFTASAASIGVGTPALPNSPLHVDGNINSYLQVEVQNDNSGASGSTDFIVSNNLGTDTTYYFDMGINSSTYSDPRAGWGGANDSFLYAQTASLIIVTNDTNTSEGIIFSLGSTSSAGHFVKMTPDKRMTINKSGSAANATLDISGSVSITGSFRHSGSVLYSDGVLNVGSVSTNVHAITGSVYISGSSFILTGSLRVSNITSSLLGTSSYATTALSSSYVATASYALAPWAVIVQSGTATTVTNSSTFADTQLSIPITSGKLYVFRFVGIGTTTSATADFKYTVNVTNSAVVTGFTALTTFVAAGATSGSSANWSAVNTTAAVLSAATGQVGFTIDGSALCTTGGNLTLQIAQNAAAGGNSVSLYTGSFVMYSSV